MMAETCNAKSVMHMDPSCCNAKAGTLRCYDLFFKKIKLSLKFFPSKIGKKNKNEEKTGRHQ